MIERTFLPTSSFGTRRRKRRKPTRAWEEHGNSIEIGTGKENRAACTGCAPLCSFTRYHEAGEARTDLGVKNRQLEWYDGCPAVTDLFHLPSRMPLHMCTASTDGHSVVSNLSRLFSRLSSLPPCLLDKSCGDLMAVYPNSERSLSHVPRLRKVRPSVWQSVSGCFQSQPAVVYLDSSTTYLIWFHVF